jgi:hypothetical protein
LVESEVLRITPLTIRRTSDIISTSTKPDTLPSKNGAKGFGMANIKKSVERAVGADILKD